MSNQQSVGDGGTRRSLAALATIKLPEAMAHKRTEEALACLQVLLESGVTTAADLAGMSCEAWLRPADGVNFRTYHAGQVIAFMIDKNLPFSDLNPAQAFKTPIRLDDPLIDVRTYNRLRRAGLMWVEILPYFTLQQIVDIRNFGIKSLARTQSILARQGLSFRSITGQ